MPDNCTYVMGYWKLPGNKKRTINHYFTYMPNTFKMLENKQIVFFYGDDDILEYVQQFMNKINFMAIKINICDLPAYTITEAYLQSCKLQDNSYLVKQHDTKGLIHYRRDYCESGEDIYRKLISIWMSKVFLIEKVIHENPFHTENFAWIDASLSRFHMNINKYEFNPLKINTYPNDQYYIGKRIYSLAAYMISSKTTWLTFIDLYKQKLNMLKDSNYAHDEETIIFSIYNDQPKLFGHMWIRIPHEKCEGLLCSFIKHENRLNNGGTHCCLGCKQNEKHGPLCRRISFENNTM